MRIALGIEYDGSNFRGWQIQRQGERTAQGCLQNALTQVANHPVTIVCAGRTDTGVHATGQVVHFDTLAERSSHAWIMGANSNLPADIGVQWAQPVPEHFHARFSARTRRYRYMILNRPYRSPLQRQRMSWCYRYLDAARMAAAGRDLIGEHDFTSFRAAGCQAKNPVRHMIAMEVQRHGDCIAMEVEANAFFAPYGAQHRWRVNGYRQWRTAHRMGPGSARRSRSRLGGSHGPPSRTVFIGGAL
jgi:tRNA pseudouridine38-40 synthase